MEQFLANPSPVFESAEKSAGPTLEVDTDYWKPSEAWKKRIELKNRLKELGDQFPKPQVDTNEMNDGSLDDLEVVEVESIPRKKSKSKQNNQAIHVEEVKYSPDIEGTPDKKVNNNAVEKPTQSEESNSADHPQVATTETNENGEQALRKDINQEDMAQEDKPTENADKNDHTEQTESNDVEQSGSPHSTRGEKEEVELDKSASEKRSMHNNQDGVGGDEDAIRKDVSDGSTEDKSAPDSSSALNTYPSSASASTPKRDDSSEEEEESAEEVEKNSKEKEESPEGQN